MSKTIEAMPVEVKDRFKALKVLMVSILSTPQIHFLINIIIVQDQVNDVDEEEEKEYRQLELKYDKLYKEIYEERRKIV